MRNISTIMTLRTEKDAAQFSCPTRDQNCMGSKCMAWREVYERVPLTDNQMATAKTAVGLAVALQPRTDVIRGYCGVGGNGEQPHSNLKD